ncbi:MAG: M81 family metallopeptidase [Burkholderiales bacterium]
MRIAIGGFQHETNTFAPSKATFDAFARGGAWPPLLQGGEIFDGVAGINLPIAGFIDALSFTLGFPAADFPDCAPRVFAY